MGKGAGDDCRAAMALAVEDAARPARRRRPSPGEKLLPLVRMQRMLAAERGELEPVDVPVPDRDAWAAVHRFEHGGLRVVEVDAYAHELPDGTRFSSRGESMYERYQYDAEIQVASGYAVGSVRRFLTRDRAGLLVAEMYRLRLAPEHQGNGFGPAYHDHLERAYRELGVDRVVCTPVEVGAYTWANRDGWHFDPSRPQVHSVRGLHVEPGDPRLADPHFLAACAATRLWQEREGLLDFAWGRGQIDGDTYHGFRRRFATPRELETGRYRSKICTPQQIAGWGRDRPFTDDDGHRTWPGRYLLLGCLSDRWRDIDNTCASWSAVKFL
jgi:GNAT superfamily N-acetyltransferase